MHFVIVSYVFPPSNEIGGRRWAKFSQEISTKGHKVTVVSTREKVDASWYKNNFSPIKFKLISKNYPEWLTGYTKNFLQKIFYKLYTKVYSPFLKENLFDKGYAWKSQMFKALEETEASEPIDVLIVTGAPFSLLYYGAEFKKLHPKIYLISDFRDPWTWGSYYGFPNLSEKKKRFQTLCENETIKVSDVVTFPTAHMGNFLKSMYPKENSKFYLLPHAFEPNKFAVHDFSQKRIGFIYGGSLYPGIDGYLKRLSAIVKSNPNEEFIWDIFTGTKYPLIDENFANGKVKMHGFIPEVDLFQKINAAAAYLVFFPETDKDLISTKFFEIIFAQTPILYIGEEGDVAKFIRENKCGVHILPKNMELELPKYLNANVPFEPGYFDVTKYTFENVTNEFLQHINFIKKIKGPNN